MSTFTPESVNDQTGEFVLVANHFIADPEALASSIAYNRARISFATSHLPPTYSKCRLFYDIRGQCVSNVTIQKIRDEFADVYEVQILTN